jgi:hypothetical protein
MFSGSQNLVLLGPEAEPVSARGISSVARCFVEVRILSFRFRGRTSICARNIIVCKMFFGNQKLVLLGSEAEPVSARGLSSAAKCSLEIRISFFKVQRLNQYLREEYHQLQDVLWKSESCSFRSRG